MSNRNDLPVKKEGATCCELQDMAYSQSGISGNPALHQEDQPRRQLRGKGLYFFFSTPFFTLCRLKKSRYSGTFWEFGENSYSPASPLEILYVKFSTDYKINFVFIFLQ